MADPPIQPNLSSDGDARNSANPFAPAHIVHDTFPARTELNGLFWVTFSVMALLSFALAFFGGITLGVAGFVTSAIAAVRAILVQRALSSRNCHVLPDATYLLILSWFITAGLIIATLITFVVTCVPMGMTIGAGIATAIAGTLAVLIFCGLYYASLKLPF
jgi:hypothetical protein